MLYDAFARGSRAVHGSGDCRFCAVSSRSDRPGVVCLNSYTRNQLLRDIDACSMTHSLEVRVPFMDPVIADFALSLPISAKLNANERTLDPNASYDESGVKRIVCDVARKYLPAGLFSQRSKKG